MAALRLWWARLACLPLRMGASRVDFHRRLARAYTTARRALVASTTTTELARSELCIDLYTHIWV
jgi:hypothetical protein